MKYFSALGCFLAISLLASSGRASVCPDSCICSTTRDGLHRAACSKIEDLYKFTLRQKHHNINILDLSHNNITKLTHELDRLTEVVTLDLSTNGLSDISKFLHNAKKLVHLNLANNRIKKISLTHLPTSVSSLDLTNNLSKDVPLDIGHLRALEHLEMEGNPFNCSCENIMSRDKLISANVLIDNVKCASPSKFYEKSWLELKTKDVCKTPKNEINFLDMMMGDQPFDPMQVGEESSALKSMPLVASSDLEDGNVIQEEKINEDDDNAQFLRVDRTKSSQPAENVEGSGDFESTTSHDVVETTDDPIEGSGYEGSGFDFLEEIKQTPVETSTVHFELNTGPIGRIFTDDNENQPEFPPPPTPNVYEGGSLWHLQTDSPVTVKPETEKPMTTQMIKDTTVSEPIRVTHASEMNEQPSSSEEHVAPHKTGTYICIAIIIILLVGLIGFAIIKGQIRKRRDRRLLRQQRRDVEKASKEMVDMNKSLLGKPASADSPIEKKANGKYELVPTHEPHLKKSENGDIGNGIKHKDTNGVRTDSPRDSNQNKSSSKDNNITDDMPPSQQETSFESDPISPDSRKDRHSLSSEDIFVPMHDDDLKLNGLGDASQPLLNGDQTTLSDFLSPSEYTPVYSPDMGRVRIKLSETPKPKTPVLVTRSRSNAGDIIITPSIDGNIRKSTT